MAGRFAPSPSGRMHLGNVFSALLAWLSARAAGEEFVLRIEDLDPARCRPEYGELLRDDLRWLGLDWDREMPMQSTRTQVYAEAFERLRAQGLLYPCFCTRNELHAASAPHASDGTFVYAGTCRNLSQVQIAAQTRKPAWRIRVPDEIISYIDGVYGRSDGVYAYQLAVVCDDALGGISQVVRGRDLLFSTPRQLWLFEKLGYAAPKYFHVPLLVAPDGRRLSKRERYLDLSCLRIRCTPELLIGNLAFLAGLLPAPCTCAARELIEIFDWKKIRREDLVITGDFLS